MRRCQFVYILSNLLLLFIFLYIPSPAQDPGTPDTVRVSKTQASAGSKIVVTVTAFNDEQVAGLLVPLSFSGTALIPDSVSYLGTRLDNASLKPVSIDIAAQRVLFGAIYFGTPLQPGEGVIGKIFFTVTDTALPQIITIDTYVTELNYLAFVDTNSANPQEFIPVFKTGEITITEENLPPKFEPIGNSTVYEGESLKVNLKAFDPTGDVLKIFVLNPPPGSKIIDSGDGTAQFSWVPDFTGLFSSQGSPFKVTLVVSDGVNLSKKEILIYVINKNALPIIILPQPQTTLAGVPVNFQVSALDPDKEEVILNALNLPVGATFDNQNPGTFNWTPQLSDTGFFTVTFVATDPQGGTSQKDFNITVLSSGEFVLSVAEINGYPGDVVTVPLQLMNLDSIGGFDFLLHFDNTALNLLNVTRSGTRTSNWESFTFQENYQNISGDLKVFGLADIPTLPLTPPLSPGQGPLVNLIFQINSDPGFAGFSIPVNFKFNDSTDNTLSDQAGNLIYQSDIAYRNGSVNILITNLLLGDINLNGIPFEIGDAVRFANFISDPARYPFNSQQYANSDVNQDGIPATIADLVYLIRIIVEGPSLAGKISSVTGEVDLKVQKQENSFGFYTNSAGNLGGGLFVFEHQPHANVTVNFSEALADMDKLYKDEDGALRILIYSQKGRSISVGENPLFTVYTESENLNIKQVEFSNDLGNLLKVRTNKVRPAQIPEKFSLGQNYPNPFNLETKISFSLTEEAEVSLKIYNIKGQLVKTLLHERKQIGNYTVSWNGTNQSGETVASGLYLYRLSVEDKSFTKKMSLLK
ncbi:MAG: hypothetical protein RBG1_1C00001G0582 [candidate division Zixibacteria bacterium RBG-1]|nr:MAG: hypothetical protein RBG1_1C00001G0582 [candidate division Zixibacteria bacterium RBG-1]